MENQIPPTPPQNIPIQQPTPAQPTMPDENSNRSFWKTIGIGMGIVSFCTAIAFIGYFLVSGRNKATISNQQISTVQETSTPTPTIDPTATWKTYSGDDFSFQYPLDFKVEEREKNYLAIVPIQDAILAPTQGIVVDARPSNRLSNFQLATISAKANLVDVKEFPITGGIKISGIIGPGFGQGLSITEALLQYKNGALDIETSDSTITQAFFDQILSTFKFTN